MDVSILVVEDDFEMQNILVETLEDEGYLAHGVGSVAEALKSVETTVFQILVTDVRMAEIEKYEFRSGRVGGQKKPEMFLLNSGNVC